MMPRVRIFLEWAFYLAAMALSAWGLFYAAKNGFTR